MPTESAAAALIVTSETLAYTGFISWSQGTLDTETNTIKPLTNGSWNTLTTWNTWTTYNLDPLPIKWTSSILDIGTIDDFTLNIKTEYQGTISLTVYVSETGNFNGEETIYILTDGDYNISAFYGRYVYVTATVNGSELSRLTLTSNTEKTIRHFRNVDSSTLSGNSSERTYTLPVAASKIVSAQITAQTPTAYSVDLYVSSTATSQALLPVITAKTGNDLKFRLYGIDNQPRDGIVDITVTTLPRQAMISGNLVVID